MSAALPALGRAALAINYQQRLIICCRALKRSGLELDKRNATGEATRRAVPRSRRYRYSRAVISRVRTPSSSTYQSPMTILIAGVIS